MPKNYKEILFSYSNIPVKKQKEKIIIKSLIIVSLIFGIFDIWTYLSGAELFFANLRMGFTFFLISIVFYFYQQQRNKIKISLMAIIELFLFSFYLMFLFSNLQRLLIAILLLVL